MAITAQQDRKKRGRKVNPPKDYKAILAKGNSAQIDGRIYSRGVIYHISEARAIELQKDGRMTVAKKDEKFKLPKKGEKPEKPAAPTGIPQEWVETLQKYDEVNVSDAGDFIAKIRHPKLLEFLGKNAEKSGSRKAAKSRAQDLQKETIASE